MHRKDVIAHSLPLIFRKTRRRCAAAIGAVAAALVLFVGGCDGSDSPPGTYYQGPGGFDPSNSGGGGSDFTPTPPKGVYSPDNLESPYSGCQSPYTPGC